MGRDDQQLKAAKASYREASINGNRQEEARWANVIGNILKQRGEYVEGLRWLRIDYDISVKHLPQKDLLPTCQSLGEIYLRLQRFEEALIYQKKHLELAKDTNDLVEQQRASTQLGRTYHEIFSRCENDNFAVRNAKKYFKTAMELARTLKENPLPHKPSLFLKEFIDAHNNLGMLEMDLDNLDEACKILLEGLKICDDEEVIEDDDARSRLHHNLGSLYIELRSWDKAREHIERDILICKRISHLQGEAKGYINLGELHYRAQKYDDAILCYQKALDIARSMEDEDALVDQTNQNIKTVKEAAQVLVEIKKEEQKLKKLKRTMVIVKGTADERRCLLQQNTSLDQLIEKSSMIFAWPKHLEFAKRKKKVTIELCDKEKLSDSFLAIGESYQKLRKFSKALKWYTKCWDAYRLIGNLEGQALTKINIGGVLDSIGDWAAALEAFKDGYRFAVEGNLLSVQISALENMHYSHLIRFDNVEEARKLQHDIKNLKQSLNEEDEVRNRGEYCSETETEGGGLPDNGSDASNSPIKDVFASKRPSPPEFEELSDDTPLVSLIHSSNKLYNKKISPSSGIKTGGSGKVIDTSQGKKATRSSSKDIDYQHPTGRKRIRVVLSDDEVDERGGMDNSSKRPCKQTLDDMATSDEDKADDGQPTPAGEIQDLSHDVAPKDMHRACRPRTPSNLEESSCSFKPESPKLAAEDLMDYRSMSVGETENDSNVQLSGSKAGRGHVFSNLVQKQSNHQNITCKIGDGVIHVDLRSCMDGDALDIEFLKVEAARVYYLQLSEEMRLKGVLPIVGQLKCGDKVLESLDLVESLNDHVCESGWIEIAIEGWCQKRLMKLYIDHCMKLSEAPNMKLLKKLYNLEVSEDEVIVSNCELGDMSIAPFVNALQEHKTFAILDISHNLLGNTTMEKLKQIFASSNRYRGLTLDLHSNRFGPTALFQICECPELFARLEVLNLSENRLTDSCGSYLSTILENCKGLYSLNIEQCSLTSRTIQKIADALDAESVLSELCLGRNNPISGNAMGNLLAKLASTKRFSELNLNGIKLSKLTIDSLCHLAKSSALSMLLVRSTNIGDDGAGRLTEALCSGPQEIVKLDLSCCGLTLHGFTKTCQNIFLISSLLELDVSGNLIGQEGTHALVSYITNPECALKVLILTKCRLGLAGTLQIIQASAVNDFLEELSLAENVELDKRSTQSDLGTQDNVKCSHESLSLVSTFTHLCAPEDAETAHQGFCALNKDFNGFEVADSEDNSVSSGPTISNCINSSTRSWQCDALSNSYLIQEFSTAIGMVRQLQLLDLSSNGFSAEAVEAFYSSWASRVWCGGSFQKHITEHIVHFSVEGRRCCGVSSCCKR
ncbi:hypothetical protein AAC387_Pa06g2492 [Persea americana]